MKFYNPFKPHIIEVHNNKYLVRKLTFIGYKYLDKDDCTYWWYVDLSVIRYCIFDSVELAIQVISKIHESSNPLKPKRIL